MALPETKVEIAWDSGFATAEGSRTWTDVSTYVEGNEAITITYARSDEVSAADPNKATVTLDNRDGRFTPERTSSPYYPNVTKGKPLRVSVRYNGVWYVRFTGYVDEWPLVWPDASSAAATITVSASSRRARLGLTAPLPSAIRAAYLATNPDAYWPMDEDAESFTASQQQAFRDITNANEAPAAAKQLLASFSITPALAPVVRDGTPGPTDEESLVRFPDAAPSIGALAHYVGSGNTVRVNTAGEVTIEAVARVVPAGDIMLAEIFQVDSANFAHKLNVYVGQFVPLGESYVAFSMAYYDTTTGAALVNDASEIVLGNTPDAFIAATDGQIHHYALTLTSYNVVKLYFDGALLSTMTLAGPYLFDQKFTNIAFGAETYAATEWIGHGAVHNRALTASEIATRAAAATTASETVGERVERLAGYLGVPTGEIDVEATIAAPLGNQAESGRGATEIIDEIAASTNGIAYDTRDGHLAVAARNHRYNAVTAFTLNATTQEIDGSLLPTLDDRYLTNSVVVARTGTDVNPQTLNDQTSINQNGLYQKSVEIVSTSDNEAEAAGLNMLSRYATPTVRISQVGVDVVNLSTSQCALVLAADVGTKFALAGLPAQAPTTSMSVFLEGYTETITDSAHVLEMNTTPATSDTGWILGNATLSVLGSTTIPVY